MWIVPFFESILKISTKLINWYQHHKRDLPWRKTNDPYKIWLSEVMLQQTRVQQGLPYYLKFCEAYPSIHDLAKADEQEVLSMWQGLGYYSRARNMHATAQHISENLDGVFPTEHKDIKALKGVGEYTAAAIASFAYGSPYPVIDGNVYRVVSRLFNICLPINKPSGQKEIKIAVDSIFDKRHAGEWNQAIMEFGSLQCTPKSPNCEICVLEQNCLAFAKNTIKEIPYKEGKTKVKEVDFTYLVFLYEDKTYIEKRSEGIWQNLHQHPLIEKKLNPEQALEACNNLLLNDIEFKIIDSFNTTHLLSHRKIQAVFYTISLKANPLFSKSNIFEIQKEQLGKFYPTSVLTLKYLNQQQKR